MLPLVLASASPRRKSLLDDLGIEFTVSVSRAGETLEGDPVAAALKNACAKRDDIARALTNPAVVVAADTVVVLANETLGKPDDLIEAKRMLEKLSGRTHQVITAVAVADTRTGARAEDTETTAVTFRNLMPGEIDHFVAAVRPLDRAGAYTVDGPGSLLVEKFDGCFYNVLGLPLVRLESALRRIDHSLLPRMREDAVRFL